eukprot:Skav228001  [mRNA]  locus=scaffold390:402274:414268:- [translate_table: standard]
MAGDSEQVKVIFQNWDRDGSGDISVAELTRVLKKLNPQFDQASCEKMFTSMDVNMDGTIQYDEFLNWLLSRESYQGAKAAIFMDQKRERKGSGEADLQRKTKLRAKYARLDKNGDGKLDFVEVYDFLQKRYPNMTLPDLRFLYNCADKSHDGILDFYELLDMMMTLPAQKGGEKPKKAAATEHPLSAAIMREDARKVNDMTSKMKQFKDEEQRHKEFREEHKKAQLCWLMLVMREHYAKTGQLQF